MTDSRWATIRDESNRFNEGGISKETQALLQYLVDSKRAMGVDAVATCTTDHPRPESRHRQQGTDGLGLAIDFRMRARGLNIHRAAFDLFVPVETSTYELIYADPPSGKRADGSYGPYNIKAGKRVRPYAVSGHHDHVHVAVNRGVFLKHPKPTPEENMARVPGAVDFCVMHNDDLVIAANDGAIYHFDADGAPDSTDYVGAYNANPALWGGSAPTSVRQCVGVYAIGPDRRARPDGHEEAVGYCQVFDDGSKYHWVRS